MSRANVPSLGVPDPNNPGQLLYQSPGSQSNLGELPTVYYNGWQIYSNLTDAQTAAYMAMTQDLINYAAISRWQAEQSGITVNGIPLLTNDRNKILLAGLNQATTAAATFQFKDALGNWHIISAIQARALWQGMVNFFNTLFMTENQLFNGITATPPTITTRAQIVAAIQAVAPNWIPS